jgi:transcriptional antiterminator NusG
VGKKWYVIHTQSGREEKVKANLERRIEALDMKQYVSKVHVPVEEIAEIRGGKKKIKSRTSFPGYVLIETELVEQVQELIRTAPGVTGFVGAGRKPVPLDEAEIENILRAGEEQKAKPKLEAEFTRGESIRIVEGPFANFNGTVEEAYPDKGKLKAMISIFGRSTPVELECWQVEKS